MRIVTPQTCAATPAFVRGAQSVAAGLPMTGDEYGDMDLQRLFEEGRQLAVFARRLGVDSLVWRGRITRRALHLYIAALLSGAIVRPRVAAAARGAAEPGPLFAAARA